MTVWDLLKERAFFQQCTDEVTLRQQEGTAVAYVGFDPTADSFHVGHLAPLMALRLFQEAGGQAIVLLGGGTAMIGDPSGKNTMRQLLESEILQQNLVALEQQLSQLLLSKTHHPPVKILNNADWLTPLTFIDFLRNIGRHFSVNRMLGFETIKNRIQSDGISFLEFSYPLLQAYDFLYLYQSHQCQVQIGGDDQWANIVSGVDLVRRIARKQVFGWTLPLLTLSNGQKMGKTEHGTVWLNPNKTSPYHYYQYWMNIPDSDVLISLKHFTNLSLDEIADLAKLQSQDIRKAKAQLALESTMLIHGKTAAFQAEKGARSLFSNAALKTNADIPSTFISPQRLDIGLGLLDALRETKLASSNSQARRLVEQGAIRINNILAKDPLRTLNHQDIENNAILLQAGKKRHHRLIAISEQ